MLTHAVRLVQFMCEQIESAGMRISVLAAFPGPGDPRIGVESKRSRVELMRFDEQVVVDLVDVGCGIAVRRPSSVTACAS